MDVTTIVSSAVISVLSSSVLAGLIAALVSLRTTERGIKIENVTKERAKWREKVRDRALELHRAATAGNKVRIAELHLEFSLILNPNDCEDRKILSAIARVAVQANDETLKEIAVRLGLLLKHDWERAKREAEPAWWRGREPERTSYEEWESSHR
jgi:hypothetical protein